MIEGQVSLPDFARAAADHVLETGAILSRDLRAAFRVCLGIELSAIEAEGLLALQVEDL